MRVKREKKVFLASLPSLTLYFQPRSLFDCSHVLENAKIRSVLQSMKDSTHQGLKEIKSTFSLILLGPEMS